MAHSVVDFIRPFKDNPLVVRRRWYPVPDDTPPLGFPTRYGSLKYKFAPWAASFVGPVYPIEFEKITTGTPPGLTYDHICGSPEDFLTGAVFDPAADVVYDDEWIPLCCGRQSVCVTQLCAEVPVNGVSAAQLWSYPIPHQDADATTPVWLFQRAFNEGNTAPRSPGVLNAWYPSGSASDAAFSDEMVANNLGVPQFRAVTFRRATDEAVSQRYDTDGYTLTVENGGVSGTLTAKITGGVLELCGANAQICLDLLPASVFVRGQSTITAAGTNRVDATPITTSVTALVPGGAGAGVRLPADPGGFVILKWQGPFTDAIKLYPDAGSRLNGGSANAPITLTQPTTDTAAWICARGDTLNSLFPGPNWSVTQVDDVSALGTVTSVDISTGSSGLVVGGGPITGAGTLTVDLDGDLNALAGLTGTNTIYYRSGTATWSPVTIGANLTFSGGTLSAAAPGTGTVTSVSVATAGIGISSAGSPVTTSGTITLTLSTPLQDLSAFPVLDAIPCGNGSGTWQTLGFGTFLSYAAGVITCTPPTATNGQTVGTAFAITGTAGVYQATGISVTLPTAGTYLIGGRVRADQQNSAAGFQAIIGKLRNTTAAADVANSEMFLSSCSVNGELFATTNPVQQIVTVSVPTTIELYAARSTTTFTTSSIGSDGNGRTVLNYTRLS